jgi:hypothetical protein
MEDAACATYATWCAFYENIKEATAARNLTAMMNPDQPETDYAEPMAKKFDSIVAFSENAADMAVPAGANALDTFRQNG